MSQKIFLEIQSRNGITGYQISVSPSKSLGMFSSLQQKELEKWKLMTFLGPIRDLRSWGKLPSPKSGKTRAESRS